MIGRGSFVWINVGRGKGDHPGVVLSCTGEDAIVFSGTKNASWTVEPKVVVDPADPYWRSRFPHAVGWETHFYSDARCVHYVKVSALTELDGRASLRLLLALEAIVPQAPPVPRPKPKPKKVGRMVSRTVRKS